MTNHTTQLIELLNEKIRRLEIEKNSQRREINRLTKQIKKMERMTHETAE